MFDVIGSLSNYHSDLEDSRVVSKVVHTLKSSKVFLVLGTFTSQSDVWAFGVTLWEVLTFARETPYEMMTDQQVIENACSIVAKEQQSFRCLPRPPVCSDHLYRLLLNCWKKSPAERPNFKELAQFFKRLVDSVEASI